MTSHLLYEGPELEPLLERVRTAHGADAVIVGADKVRRGGIAGFFAKEIFQVTVRAGVEAPASEASDDVPIAAERELWKLVAPSAPDSEEPPDTESFASMLDRLVGEHLAAEQHDEHTAGHNGEPDARRPAADTPEQSAEAVAPEWTPPPPPPPAPPVPTAPTAPTAPAAQQAITTRRLPSPSTAGDESTGSVIALRPRRVMRSAGSANGLDELLAQFENAWLDAGPLPSNGVTVVIGELEVARRAATAMAESLGITTDRVVVASPHPAPALPSPTELADVMSVLRSQGPAALLVVELEPGITGHEWARAVVSGVEPARVDLAVEASAGFDQVRRTVIAMGGVDAIDLLDVATSHCAEELLEMNIPIATLDGRTASPALWAATVLARPGARLVDVSEDLGPTGRRSDEWQSLGSRP